MPGTTDSVNALPAPISQSPSLPVSLSPSFPRFTEAEIEAHTAPLKARIAELEAQAAGRKG